MKNEGVEADIVEECDAVKAMLVAKNRAYGNSALDPVRVFSRADTAEQIRVRIDDKLSRLQRGTTFGTEDTTLDLIGYLVLLRVAMKREAVSMAAKGDAAIRAQLHGRIVEGMRGEVKRTPVTFDALKGSELDAVGAELGLPRVHSRLGGVESDAEYRVRLRAGSTADVEQVDLRKLADDVAARARSERNIRGLSFDEWHARSKQLGSSPGHVLAWWRGEPPEEHSRDCSFCGVSLTVRGHAGMVEHHPACKDALQPAPVEFDEEDSDEHGSTRTR